ncbi:MAG: ATP-binding cassette domain-containing protein [Desulfofustis sp.]|nr:ATP-binding cassette domain-containing protein [Desulfofustis sp.]
MNAPAIQITDLTLRFGSAAPLFDKLNLDIVAGKITCILGPSGCGKSTLLRLLSGASEFDSEGTVEFSPAESSMVAWMGQDDLLLPWLSLIDNVLLGARLRGEISDALREQASELIARGRLAGFEDTLPQSLSGGMRQRAALLRTLMEGRTVLLMDEPFSALDALTRLRLQDLSAELTRGTTTVLVTHDAAEALRMAHRIIILGGTPTQVKTTLDLYSTPPRSPDSDEVLDHYSQLLELLLEDHH